MDQRIAGARKIFTPAVISYVAGVVTAVVIRGAFGGIIPYTEAAIEITIVALIIFAVATMVIFALK